MSNFVVPPVITCIKVTHKRDIPAMSSRRLRALLHQMWIAGNESYHLHTDAEALEERSATIDKMMLREGFATPKVKP
jgi:hypothetical protein